MRRLSRLMFAGCMAACALGLLAGTAMGSRAIRMESTGAKRLIAREVIFREVGGAMINCEIRMFGEHGILNGAVFMPRPVVEIFKGSAGRLPEGVFARVVAGEVVACREVLALNAVLLVNGNGGEFLFRYDGFEGVLPNITGIRLTVLRFSIKFIWAERTCLYEGNAPARKFERGGGRAFDQLRFTEALLTLVAGNVECPREARMSGTFLIEPRLIVSLVP